MKLGNYYFCCNLNRFSWYDDDELVATVELKEEKGVKWISGVYVSPLYRRHSIGTQLLQFATILGGNKLCVSKTNEAAKSLYKQFGFQIFDEDKECFYMELEAPKDGKDRSI